MKKKSLMTLLGIVMMFNITGCLQLKKDPITTEKFISVAEADNMTVADVAEQYAEYDFILEATVAQDENENWKIEFYKLESPEKAAQMLENNKEILKKERTAQLETSKEAGNYETWSCTGDGKYSYLSYIEDTFLYVNVDEEYKEEVSEYVEKLGY